MSDTISEPQGATDASPVERDATLDDYHQRTLVGNASKAYDLATDTLVDLISSPEMDEETKGRAIRDIGRAAYWISALVYEAASLGMKVDERYVIGPSFDKEKDYHTFVA